MKVQFRSPPLSAFVLALTMLGASAALADMQVNPQPGSLPLVQQSRAGASVAPEKGVQYEGSTASGETLDATRPAPMHSSAVFNEPDWTGFEYTAK